MVELYESQINSTEDLLDIADFLTEDPQYKKSVLKYIDNPFDADIERVGKGTFTVAVSKADSPSLDKLDPATALRVSYKKISAKLRKHRASQTEGLTGTRRSYHKHI